MSFHGDGLHEVARRMFPISTLSHHGGQSVDGLDPSYDGKIGKTIVIRDVILDPGDDEEFDASDYQEIRLELLHLGHNLVRHFPFITFYLETN